MESKQDLLLKSIKDWIQNYENEPEHDNQFCIELKDSAFELFLEIKDSIEMGEL